MKILNNHICPKENDLPVSLAICPWEAYNSCMCFICWVFELYFVSLHVLYRLYLYSIADKRINKNQTTLLLDSARPVGVTLNTDCRCPKITSAGVLFSCLVWLVGLVWWEF